MMSACRKLYRKKSPKMAAGRRSVLVLSSGEHGSIFRPPYQPLRHCRNGALGVDTDWVPLDSAVTL